MTHVIAPSAWRAQPWKNGGGVTHELWTRGPADAYDVRVSIADVARARPFSQFPGYRRWSFLAGDAPITLAGELPIQLVALGDHVEVPGELALTASLPAGPTRLANVLARVPIVAGFGPTAHPVELVVALVDRPGLPRWHVLVFESPAVADTAGCAWIALR